MDVSCSGGRGCNLGPGSSYSQRQFPERDLAHTGVDECVICDSVFLIFQPSYSDIAANPKVLKWMTELTKLRKQIKGIKWAVFQYNCILKYYL